MGVESDVGRRWVEVRWHGRGGQGVVTASNLLAESALLDNLYFQSLPEFGAERSGAPVVAYTRIADTPIPFRFPVQEPHIVVVLDYTLWGHLPVVLGLRPGGLLLVNTPASPQVVVRSLGWPLATVATLDATAIAQATLGRPIPNVPILGGLLRLRPVVSLEAVQATLRQRLSARLGHQAMQANLQAFERGYQQVQSWEGR
ncbi:Pyruvate synthase subunit PorC [bacterium HR23]|nr:Pyruvate synthase subunit PorC [bacterium HR23]